MAGIAGAGAIIGAFSSADIFKKLWSFGADIAALPELLVNTLDTIELDAEVTKLIGVSRLPSFAEVSGSVTGFFTSGVDSISSTASSISNISIGDYI